MAKKVSSSLKGKSRKPWDGAKHPRGARGRFTETPDQPKSKLERVRIGVTGQRRVNAIATSHGMRLDRAIELKRLEIYADMSREQRGRLLTVLSRKQTESPSLPVEPTTNIKKASANAETTTKAVKKRRLPIARPVVDRSNLTFDTKGSIEIWKDKPELAKHDSSFKASTDKKFKYAIEHDGRQLLLNQNHDVITYKGEKVKGMPSLHPKIKDDPDQRLFDHLAQYMGHVENYHSNKVSPPAPEWKPTIHGAIANKSLVRSKKGAGNYGEMQIHHVNQWLRGSFLDIQKRHKAGEITLDEAKAETNKLLQKTTRTSKDGKKTKEVYEINPLAQKDRSYVILASGVHDINSPLYEANHPKGYHPKSGKLESFGIPKTGSGSRADHDIWRAGFWTEVYRKEVFTVKVELDRRIKAGTLNPEKAKEYWDTAHEKVARAYQAVLELRKARDNNL